MLGSTGVRRTLAGLAGGEGNSPRILWNWAVKGTDGGSAAMTHAERNARAKGQSISSSEWEAKMRLKGKCRPEAVCHAEDEDCQSGAFEGFQVRRWHE